MKKFIQKFISLLTIGFKDKEPICRSKPVDKIVAKPIEPFKFRNPEYYCPKLDLSYDDVHDFDR